MLCCTLSVQSLLTLIDLCYIQDKVRRVVDALSLVIYYVHLSLVGMLGSEKVFRDILDHQFILQYIINCYKINVLVKDISNTDLFH